MNNFSAKVFRERERALAEERATPAADLSEWRLEWHEDVLGVERAEVDAGITLNSDILDMEQCGLICCPEDQICSRDCKALNKLCDSCQVPICAACMLSLDHNHLSPMGLMNDNHIGYLDPWIYETDIT